MKPPHWCEQQAQAHGHDKQAQGDLEGSIAHVGCCLVQSSITSLVIVWDVKPGSQPAPLLQELPDDGLLACQDRYQVSRVLAEMLLIFHDRVGICVEPVIQVLNVVSACGWYCSHLREAVD